MDTMIPSLFLSFQGWAFESFQKSKWEFKEGYIEEFGEYDGAWRWLIGKCDSKRITLISPIAVDHGSFV